MNEGADLMYLLLPALTTALGTVLGSLATVWG
jgi:hypothetical protein